MKQTVFTGRVWIIQDQNQNLIPDIDTDQIFHNAHLHITDIKEMGKFSFGNLQDWEDFSTKAKPDDMIIVGRNFGSGSSRQQAVDCFKSLGIRLIMAESFGAIYKRNAINSGFPILEVKEVEKIVAQNKLKNLQKIKVDLLSGQFTNLDSGEIFNFVPFSKVQKDIYEKDTLLNI